MSKLVKIYYNGERGWNANIIQVLEYLRIQQDFKEWVKFSNPETGETNGRLIIEAYDNRTALRLDYVKEVERTSDDGIKYIDYEPNQEKNLDGENLVGNEPMPWPVVLLVESTKITRDILINQTNLISSSSVGNFNAGNEEGFSFSADTDGYISRNNLIKRVSYYDNFTKFRGDSISVAKDEWDYVIKHKKNLRVWLWSKSMNENNYANGQRKPFDKNSLMDITPFILSINTNVVKSGGSFSMNLIPIEGEIPCMVPENGDQVQGVGKWFIPSKSYHVWENNGERNFVFKSEINRLNPFPYSLDDTKESTFGNRFQANKHDGKINTVDAFSPEDFLGGERDMSTEDWIRMKSFFTNIVAENDLIFISFEDDQKVDYEDDFFLSVDEIQGKEWTMIGLVDTNSNSMNAEGTDISISVTGRDLMKLLIEDGSFFFQKSFANPDQKETAFNNINLPKSGDGVNALNRVIDRDDVSSVNRLVTTGLLETLYNQDSRNVGFIMNLLISQLANIEVCPSQIFDSYGDRRTKFQVEVKEFSKEKE